MDDENPRKPKRQKPLSRQEALSKILHYCAYQERSHREVRNKLFGYGLPGSDVDELTAHLITEGFLNEERYAKTFAGGKFRMLKWGRVKIRQELEMEGLTSRCIDRGLAEIDPAAYQHTLDELIRKKADGLQAENAFEKMNKIARFAIAKGFEPELVWPAVKELFS